MPRYVFNTHKDSHAPNSVDVDLPDLATARHEAAKMMADDLRFHVDQFWNDEEWHIEVTNERGLILFTVYSGAINTAAGRPRAGMAG